MKTKVLALMLCTLMFTQWCASIKEVVPQMEKGILTISDFTKVKIGMIYENVIELMGEPSNIAGFNFISVIYKLSDGSNIKLLFQPNTTLIDINIVDPDGRIFRLKQEE